MTRQQRPARRATRSTGALVLTIAVLLAAVWIAPRASARAHTWMQAPPVKTRMIEVHQDVRVAPQQRAQSRLGATAAAPSGPLTLDAEAPFTMLGVLCDTPRGAENVAVRLRTSLDGTSWSDWLEAPLERSQADGAGPAAFSEAIWTGPGQMVQLSAISTTDAAPVELSGVRLVTLDTGVSETIAEKAVTAVRRTVATVAGVDFAAPAAAAITEPAIVTRAQWGANESLRKESPVLATVKMAFVHHSAGGNTYTMTDAPALVRGIYAYHTQTLGWNDIGYNFLVDRFGTIYEGRYGGTKLGVVGAQVYGFNTGSTGISVLGTYTETAPPDVSVAALEKLLAWKLSLHGLNPLTSATMTCGATDKYKSGSSVKLPVISGHRDANYTACPGNAFYALMPSIRKDVGRLFPQPSISGLTLSTTVVSPNGDGVRDTVKVTSTLADATTWTLRVRDASGATLRTFSGQGSAVSVTWDGKNTAGAALASGSYTLVLTATSAYGSAATKSASVGVDTVAPRILNVSLLRTWLSPNGDGWGDTTRVTYAPSEACALRMSIIDARGVTQRVYHDWTAVSTTQTRAVTWGGKAQQAGVNVDAPDGSYKYLIEARDAAGNTRRVTSAVTLDRTIGHATVTPTTVSPNGDGIQDATQVGFTLTRPATVVVTFLSGGKTVRTLTAGALAAGKRSVNWNGRTSSGTAAPDGPYAVRIAATSSLGTSSGGTTVVADRYKPRLSAPATSLVTLGQTATVNVTAADPHSPEIAAWCTVTNAKNEELTRAFTGWVKTGTAAPVSWKPTSRGTFTLTFHARDRGGNREYASVRTILTVR